MRPVFARLPIGAVFTVAVLTVAVPAAPAAAKDLRTYEDARFGTVAAVPVDWRQLLRYDRCHGARFVSPDGKSWLAIYAVPQTGSVTAHMDATARTNAREDVDYQVRRPGWLVASGTRGPRVFYRKAVLTCHGTLWHHIAFEYPARIKSAYEPLVSIVSRSLDPAEDSCP